MGPAEPPPCLVDCGRFFDAYPLQLLACGLHGALWDYVKGDIGEAAPPTTASRLDWLRAPRTANPLPLPKVLPPDGQRRRW